MCTAITFKTKDFYFGRTLDYEFSFGEEVTITPRNYEIKFSNNTILKNHYSIIGMAHICNNYPLYYDAINEHGLAIAGLNFTRNAVYNDEVNDKDNVSQYEFILWILSQSKNIDEAKALLSKINITNKPFSDKIPPASLHWIISDKDSAITIESTKEGLNIYDNEVGVLTNNPPFNIQMENLKKYNKLSPKSPEYIEDNKDYSSYSRGLGAVGLPGDLSSKSRFVRAYFVKKNSKAGKQEEESVNQFFHILNSVEQQHGCCEVENNKYEKTIYTSCCNATQGIYYYSTYENHQISKIEIFKEDLSKNELISYPIIRKEQFFLQN